MSSLIGNSRKRTHRFRRVCRLKDGRADDKNISAGGSDSGRILQPDSPINFNSCASTP